MAGYNVFRMRRHSLSLLIVLCASFALSQAPAPVKPIPVAPEKPPVPAEQLPANSGTSNPMAIIETTAGNFRCELFPTEAPNAVANFIGLSRGTKDWTDPRSGKKVHGTPLYDGTIFHRVIPNFMIQGGDPLGNGSGDVGFSINDEFSPNLTFDKPGLLAYANSGPNTNASQFFITEVPVPTLNPCMDAAGCVRGSMGDVPKGYGYTIFGQCDAASIDLVAKIARMPRDEQNNNRPYNPVVINKIDIIPPKQ